MEISPWWRHGAVLTVIVGLSGLIFMGTQVYRGAPPIFEKAVDQTGRTVFTKEDILGGQAVFQKYGLMDEKSARTYSSGSAITFSMVRSYQRPVCC